MHLLMLLVGIALGWFLRGHFTSVAASAGAAAHGAIEKLHLRLDGVVSHGVSTNATVTELKKKVEAIAEKAGTIITTVL